jgi:type VI secretion system protein ImpJ
MKSNNRVAWHQGLFVRQHHFQQTQRHLDWLLDQRVSPLIGNGWGFTSLVVDTGTLGHVALVKAEGLMPDGTPAAMPGEMALPASISVPKATQDCLVHLALPRAHPADADMPDTVGGPVSGARWHRYTRHQSPLPDRIDGGTPEKIDLAFPQFRLLLDTERRDDLVCMPVARIVETHPDGRVILDDSFMPPLLSVTGSPLLTRFLTEIAGLIDQRINRLAEITTDGQMGSVDHLLLWGLNRHRGVFHHLTDMSHLHPHDLYREMLRLAGELSTLFAPQRKATRFQAYRHDDLAGSFRPVMAELRRGLSTDLARCTDKVPLTFNRELLQWDTGRLDPSHLDGWRFILSFKTTVPAEDLHKAMKNRALISSRERMPELRRAGAGGAGLLLQPYVPLRINDRNGRVFLEIIRQGDDWAAIRRDQSLAVYIAGADATVDLQLWISQEDVA